MVRSAPPTTIAQALATGVKRVKIHCDNIRCFHSEVFDIASFGLPGDLRIPKFRRFVCSRCGGRKIGIRFEYPPAPGTPGYNGGKYQDEDG